jgi:hypothetical protein
MSTLIPKKVDFVGAALCRDGLKRVAPMVGA